MCRENNIYNPYKVVSNPRRHTLWRWPRPCLVQDTRGTAEERLVRNCEERKGRIPYFYSIHKKDLLPHYILDLYTYTHSWVPQYSKKIKEKDCTISNTPPQPGAYMSYAPSLLQMYLILGPLRDLVKMSAS